jgi:hypothetical protein
MSIKTQQQEVHGRRGPVSAKGQRSKQPNRSGQPGGSMFEPNAAGIDIGAREIFVAVPPDGIRIRFGGAEHLPEICSKWPIGWSSVASPARLWSPRVCIGFQCTMCWNNTGSNRVW